MKRLTLVIATISVVISTLLMTCPSEVSAYKSFNRLKFFERMRLVKKEDGGFDYSSNIGDIIRLDMVPDYIDSVMIVDIHKADSIWKSKGDTISEEYQGKKMIFLDKSNLPRKYDIIKSPELERLTSNILTGLFSENPSEVKWYKSGRKFLKKKRNCVHIDYAICNDSLIICVYRSVLDMSGKHGKKRILGHINFIHRYNCDNNDWELFDINDDNEYFPEYYKTDILRSFTAEDLKSFIRTHYDHKHWRERVRFNNEFSLSDLYEETYIKSSDFPIGALCGITDSLYRLPNNFQIIKRMNSFFKSAKSVIGVDYTLKGDSLIISFSEQINVIIKKETCHTRWADLGYYTYRYDCATHKWEKISEDFSIF